MKNLPCLRSSGNVYCPGDADYLLCHARDTISGNADSLKLFGSLFVSFQELERLGYLRVDARYYALARSCLA